MHAFYRNELHHAHQSKQRFKHAQTAGRSFLDWFCVCGVENVHSGPMTTAQPSNHIDNCLDDDYIFYYILDT